MTYNFGADLALVNGNIITVDSPFSIAQAVAVKDGKIIAIGKNEDIKALLNKATQVIDLKKKPLIPGINDSHIHASLLGSNLPPVAIDLSRAESIDEILRSIKEKARTAKPGEWIRGTGLDSSYLSNQRGKPAKLPTRLDLDTVSPENPVYLGVTPFHAERLVLLNSRALELTRINKDTTIPGGEVVKDSLTGEPTGFLIGAAAEALVKDILPPLTREEKKQAIQAVMVKLNSLGITSITEPGLGPGGKGFWGGIWDTENIHIYNDLSNQGKLTLRVSILLLFTPYGSFATDEMYAGLSRTGTHSGFGSDWLRIAGIKLYADGVPPNRTAWMGEEYVGGGFGKMVFPGESDADRCQVLKNIIGQAHDLGFQVGIHATGDRSISACIESFASAEQRNPLGLRHYIVHGDFTNAAEAVRMAQYQIGLSVQPGLAVAFSPFLRFSISANKAEMCLPLKSLIDSGVHVAGGSDSPVVDPDWRAGIQAAVLRVNPQKRIFGSHHRITVQEAIRMYTIEGAWQDHMENLKGSIEVGKLADLCVLGEDILSVDSHQIKNIPILMTIAGGKIVFNAGG